MPVNYSIQSEVIDLRSYTPQKNETFFVDTNVWYWYAYLRAGISPDPPRGYQINDYPNFIKSILNTKATLVRSPLSFAELANTIENTEHKIFTNSNGRSAAKNRKEFRHNCTGERTQTISEIEAAWILISMCSENYDIKIDDVMVDNTLEQLKKTAIDVYDAYLLKGFQDQGCKNIITDDGDFTAARGLRIFTANPSVLQSATAQNKLR